jgi:hypothetical protein
MNAQHAVSTQSLAECVMGEIGQGVGLTGERTSDRDARGGTAPCAGGAKNAR